MFWIEKKLVITLAHVDVGENLANMEVMYKLLNHWRLYNSCTFRRLVEYSQVCTCTYHVWLSLSLSMEANRGYGWTTNGKHCVTGPPSGIGSMISASTPWSNYFFKGSSRDIQVVGYWAWLVSNRDSFRLHLEFSKKTPCRPFCPRSALYLGKHYGAGIIFVICSFLGFLWLLWSV